MTINYFKHFHESLEFLQAKILSLKKFKIQYNTHWLLKSLYKISGHNLETWIEWILWFSIAINFVAIFYPLSIWLRSLKVNRVLFSTRISLKRLISLTQTQIKSWDHKFPSVPALNLQLESFLVNSQLPPSWMMP